MNEFSKKEEGKSSDTPTNGVAAASLPKTQGGRQGLFSEVAKEVSSQQKNIPSMGPSTKEKLIDSYLKGEISLGEMTHKLKVFNSVVADSVLRDSKESGASQINSQDASRMGSGISQAGLAKAMEKSGVEEGASSSTDVDDEAKRRQIQKQEEKTEQREQEQTVANANLFERESSDIKRAQKWREIEKLQKEESEEYVEKKLEEELLVASDDRKSALAREREMKVRATATKRTANESTSGGGKRAGR